MRTDLSSPQQHDPAYAGSAPPPQSSPGTAQQRRKAALELILDRKDISVNELCTLLGASPHAVRRDLRALEAQGVIRRSYGRALAVPGSRWELGIHDRRMFLTETYARIADSAAEELHEAETIFVDEGNLPAMVVPRLQQTKQLTVVTASLQTALRVSESSNHEVIIVGGKVRPRTLASVGYWAREMLAGLSIDLAFLGTNGVSMTKGLSTPDERVAQIKREALRSSKRNVVLTPGDRFGVAQFVQFASIPEVDLFVTDPSITPRQRDHAESRGAVFKIAT